VIDCCIEIGENLEHVMQPSQFDKRTNGARQTNKNDIAVGFAGRLSSRYQNRQAARIDRLNRAHIKDQVNTPSIDKIPKGVSVYGRISHSQAMGKSNDIYCAVLSFFQIHIALPRVNKITCDYLQSLCQLLIYAETSTDIAKQRCV